MLHNKYRYDVLSLEYTKINYKDKNYFVPCIT